MPQIQLYMPSHVLPGATVRGKAVITCAEEIDVDAIDLEFVGRKRVHDTFMTRDFDLFDDEARIAGETALPAGVTEVPFELTIPADAQASFYGIYAVVRYYVDIRLRRAWRRDPSVRTELIVLPDPNSIHGTFSTQAVAELEPGRPAFELTLDESSVRVGDKVRGAVQLHRVSRLDYQAMTLHLACIEAARLQEDSPLATLKRDLWRTHLQLPVDLPHEEQLYPFELDLPPHAPPTIMDPTMDISWELTATARTVAGNLSARLQVLVVPATATIQPVARPTELLMIANDNTRAWWSYTANQLGLEFSGCALRGLVGDTELTMRVVGVDCLGELRFPSLGIDLTWVRNRRAARTMAQLMQFTDRFDWSLVDTMRDVEILDDLFTARVDYSDHDPQRVFELAQRLVAVARSIPALRASFPALPFAHGAGLVETWRQLAHDLQGQLRLADLCISSEIRGYVAEARMDWTHDATPYRTAVAVYLPEPLPASAVFRAHYAGIAEAVRRHLHVREDLQRRIVAGATGISVEGTRIQVFFEPHIDPLRLAGRLRTVADVVHELTGHDQYRL